VSPAGLLRRSDHADAVLEFPQSQERFERKASLVEGWQAPERRAPWRVRWQEEALG
jgi:hypothetical protein